MNKIVIAAALWIGSVSANVHAANWTVDPATSEVGFTATFESSKASGTFRKFDASVQFDPDRPADSRIDITVTVASADMISDDINKALRGPDWFDAGRFPVAEFHSTDMRAAGTNAYVAVGTIKIKDIAKPIEVPFSWKREGDSALVNGELTINRSTFRIGLGEWLSTKIIGADVKVKFSVRLRSSG